MEIGLNLAVKSEVTNPFVQPLGVLGTGPQGLITFDKVWSALTDPLASTWLRQGSSVDESQARLAQQRFSVLYLA